MTFGNTMRRSTMFAVLVLGVMAQSEAQAQGSSSCQTDFQKVMGPRQALIARINGFQKKRPTADQACSILTQLGGADKRVIAWMTENKDWCQIPDELLEQIKGSTGQAEKSRSQACSAASQQRSQIAKARAAQARAAAQQGGGGPAPVGSGVRLPQGAL